MIFYKTENKNEKAIKKIANSYARKCGYGVASGIVLGDSFKIVERVRPGWRKFTTNEYVPNAYRNNFGWKNTYYQTAVTIVEIDIKVLK